MNITEEMIKERAKSISNNSLDAYFMFIAEILLRLEALESATQPQGEGTDEGTLYEMFNDWRYKQGDSIYTDFDCFMAGRASKK
jgi:hypothetical protein